VICLDVKIGDGAFMKTIEDARELSRIMVSIGESFGKKVTAFITGMDQPLGFAVGNRLEVKEAIETLSGKGPKDLETLCIEIASYMVFYAEKTKSVDEARTLVTEKLHNGEALTKFNEFIHAQGGHIDSIQDFIKVKEVYDYQAKNEGFIKEIKALNIGLTSMKLGGGRATKEDKIDPMVGIVLNKKVSDYVRVGDTLAYVYMNSPLTSEIVKTLDEAFEIVNKETKAEPIIYEVITHE